MSPDRLVLVFGLLAGVLLLVGLSAALLLAEARQRDLQQRVFNVSGLTDAGASQTGGRGGTLTWLLQGFGAQVRRGTRFYSDKDLAELQGVITAAGLDPKRTLSMIVGAKVLLLVLLPGIMVFVAITLGFSSQHRLLAVGAGAVVGILAPEVVLKMLRRSYTEAVRRGIPDALDLLVVCSEAGMGLESALERVALDMQQSNRPMAVVLAGLLDDMRVRPDRREAFAAFGQRVGVPGLQRLATMLGQSLQYGTPLSQALRAVAAELRRESMSQLEEKAAKLPVKLVIPMILFIMPCLYVVLMGVAMLRLYDAFHLFMGNMPHH